MKKIHELQKKIESARHELDEAFLQKDEFEQAQCTTFPSGV